GPGDRSVGRASSKEHRVRAGSLLIPRQARPAPGKILPRSGRRIAMRVSDFAARLRLKRQRDAIGSRSMPKGAEMRKIYKISRHREGGRAAAVAIMIGALAIVGIAFHRAGTTDAVAAKPAAASASAPAPTVYFPSQYELHAGPPEE